MNDLKLKRGEALLAIVELIKSGYAGVLPNGNVVDRRIHPDAVPAAENPMFGNPKPKPVKVHSAIRNPQSAIQ